MVFVGRGRDAQRDRKVGSNLKPTGVGEVTLGVRVPVLQVEWLTVV